MCERFYSYGLGFVMIWLARIVVLALVLSALPARAAASSPLAPLPATIRVNISLLGTTYAKIGSTGSLTVTREDGAVLYQGSENTVARRAVRRLADPSRTHVSVRDPDDRRRLLQPFRQARQRARVDEIPAERVPFVVSFEGDGSDPLPAPL